MDITQIHKGLKTAKIDFVGCDSACYNIPVVPTGVYPLDNMLGGGFPVGRVSSVVGKGGVGKSTLMYSFLYNVVRYGGMAILIDPDYSYTLQRMQELGYGDAAKNIIILNKVTIEGFLAHFKTLVEIATKASDFRFGFIVVDTFSNLPSEQEMKGGTPGVSIHARQISAFFRIALQEMAAYNMGVIFTCHEKAKISTMPGVMAGYGYLAQNAIYANSFIELRMIRTQQIKQALSGFRLKAETRKNKMAPPFQEVVLDYYYTLGYDRAKNILDGMVARGFATKGGGWYTLSDTGEKFQAAALRQQPSVMDHLETNYLDAQSQTTEVCDDDIDPMYKTVLELMNSLISVGMAEEEDVGVYKLTDGTIVNAEELAKDEGSIQVYAAMLQGALEQSS